MKPDMDLDLLRAYYEMAEEESLGVIRSYRHIDQLVNELDLDHPEWLSDDPDAIAEFRSLVLDSILLVIIHAAALSKMFWPMHLPANPAKDTTP